MALIVLLLPNFLVSGTLDRDSRSKHPGTKRCTTASKKRCVPKTTHSTNPSTFQARQLFTRASVSLGIDRTALMRGSELVLELSDTEADRVRPFPAAGFGVWGLGFRV